MVKIVPKNFWKNFSSHNLATLPDKTTTRTVKTGQNHGVFVKHAGEIFWQPIRGNLHWRQGFMAMKPRRDLLDHLGHLRNSLGSDRAARQGIMAKSGIYVTKHTTVACKAGEERNGREVMRQGEGSEVLAVIVDERRG
jgi:hypothetical protein